MIVRGLMRATVVAASMVAGVSVASAQPEAAERFSEDYSDEMPDDAMTWKASLGLVYATGNTESWTLNAGTQFRVVRNRHAFALDWTFAYGRADLTPNDDTRDFVDTVRNSNARARYDFYLTRMNALFAAVAHRWDTFAGLDTRLQAQAGYLRNFIREEDHRLWVEVGYDFTYDDYVPTQDPLTAMDAACDPMMGAPDAIEDRPDQCIVDGQNVHAARAFVGYDNELNEMVLFTGGVEALFNLQDADDIRVNLDLAVTSTLSQLFKLEVKFKLLFDNVPVPDKGNLDALLTVNLVFAWEQEQPVAEEGAGGEEG